MTEMQNDGHSLFCNLILINSLLTQNNKMRLTSYMGALTTVPITYCRFLGCPYDSKWGQFFTKLGSAVVSISSIQLGVLEFNSLPLELEGMHKTSSYFLLEYDYFTKLLLNNKESRDSLEVTFPYIWPFSHFD